MRIPFDELESVLSWKQILNPHQWLSQAAGRLKTWWRSFSPHTSTLTSLRHFYPKVRLYIERFPYVVKTVESSWELDAALRLRARVFYGELLGQARPPSHDIDRYDLSCDHLVIIDERSSRCIGTYRLISSTYSNDFYSANEFDLSEFLKAPGKKLELGRACIDKEFRTGVVVGLLWNGICQYAEKVGADVLFGCSSVQTTNPVVVSKICTYLRRNSYVAQDLEIPPLASHRFAHAPQTGISTASEDAFDEKEAKRHIPPLLLSYLKAGAQVGREPALDRAFECVDFMTVLSTRRMRGVFDRKFNRRTGTMASTTAGVP